jgi:hypothetical protein
VFRDMRVIQRPSQRREFRIKEGAVGRQFAFACFLKALAEQKNTVTSFVQFMDK